MHQMPSFGKALCRFYMDDGRADDAIAVAATCYAAVRDQVTRHTPVGERLGPALDIFLLWAEICGNRCEEAGQKYMAGMIYATTVQDLKRFNWGSPVTRMFARTQIFSSRIFENVLDRLGPDSDDEDDDDEPPVPEERRWHMAVLKPAADPAAPIKITLSTVD
jgi:hypothetical protein